MKVIKALVIILSILIIKSANGQTVSKEINKSNIDSFLRKMDSIYGGSNKNPIFLIMGALVKMEDNPDSALSLLNKATLFKNNDSIKNNAFINNLMGLTNYYKGDNVNAIKNFLEALKIFENLKDEESIASVYFGLGLVYFNQSEDSTSLVYFQKALNYCANSDSIKDKSIIGEIYIQIASVYEKQNKLDSAKLYISRFNQVSVENSDTSENASALEIAGNIFLKKEKYEIALEYFRMALSQTDFNDSYDQTQISSVALSMAELFEKTDKIVSSFYFANLSFLSASKTKSPKYILKSAQFLYTLYQKVNNRDSSFKYLQISSNAKDSVYNQENIRLTQKLTFSEDLRQKEKAERKREELKERVNNIQILGIGTFIFICFSFVYIFSRSKTKFKVYRIFGIITLLLMFEFISLLLHPFIEEITNHTAIFSFLFLIAIASILVPGHHYFEKKVKQILSDKIESQITDEENVNQVSDS